jgi:tetratricopeptide (TPR) repeat protein
MDREASAQPSLAVRLMQVAGEFELDRKREKQRFESRIQRLEDLNEALETTNHTQEKELEVMSKRVAKLGGDLEQLSSQGLQRVKDAELLLVETRWRLAERTQQLLSLHKALKSLQTPASRKQIPGSSENDDPEGGALVAAGRLCESLRSSTGLDLEASLRELEAASLSISPFSIDAALVAAERGDVASFDRILQPCSGAAGPPSAPDEFTSVIGQALCRAVAGGHLALASRCIALGASPSIRSTSGGLGQSALLLAAAGGYEAIVKLLLAKSSGGNASIDDTDAYRRTALHLAAAGNHAAVAKLLLFNGASPDAVDCNGLTPGQTAEGTEALLLPLAAEQKKQAGNDRRPGAHFRTGELPVNRRAPAVVKVLADSNVRFWNASVRANRAYQEKRFGAAIAAYSDALDLAMGSASAASPRDLATLHYNRARARYRLGAHCAAIDDCSTALEHDPSYRNALAQVCAALCWLALL